MSRNVLCTKLNQEEIGLARPPLPGPLGEKIYNHISAKAWGMWLSQQTMLINEYRLNLVEPQAREFLRKEMENFLFKDQNVKPPGFVGENN